MKPDKMGTKGGAVMEKKPVTILVTATRHDILSKIVYFMEAKFEKGGGEQDKTKLKFKKKAGAFDLTFKLKDETGLGLKFCRPIDEAIYVEKGDHCPPAKGTGGGVIGLTSVTDCELMVSNANLIEETLSFMLRFDGVAEGAFDPPYEYDPKIINGGG